MSSPQRGEPSSSKLVTRLMSVGRLGKKSPEGQNNSQLDRFKCSPHSGPRVAKRDDEKTASQPMYHHQGTKDLTL